MWHLTKYARFVETATPSSESKNTWEYFDTSISPLELIVGDNGQLIINHGSTIMESYNLSIAKRSLRGQCKADSMIIFCHMQDVSHRFRVKFSATESKTSDEACKECAQLLAKYFPIKMISTNIELTGEQGLLTDEYILQGEITLSDLAHVVTGTGTNQLPRVYRNTSALPTDDDDVDVLLKLCLSDPCFPAYVEQVELKLNQLKSDINV